MQTTINRDGQVTQLTYRKGDQAAVIAFHGGYIKFFFNEQDIPDGLMLKDKVEITIVIKNSDE